MQHVDVSGARCVGLMTCMMRTVSAAFLCNDDLLWVDGHLVFGFPLVSGSHVLRVREPLPHIRVVAAPQERREGAVAL